MTHAAGLARSPIDQNAGSLPALAAVLESVLDVIRGEAVIPHHVRLEFVLKQRMLHYIGCIRNCLCDGVIRGSY